MQSGRPENRIQYYENMTFFTNLGSRNGIFCLYQIWVETDKKNGRRNHYSQKIQMNSKYWWNRYANGHPPI